MAQILDGKSLANNLKEKLKSEIELLRKKTGLSPYLVSILVGKDEGSLAYAGSQKKMAESIGISYELLTLASDISQKELIAKVKVLNEDDAVSSIMLYRPFPKHIDEGLVANSIDPKKDVEGTHVSNIGQLILGGAKILPCTPASVMEHIKSTGVNLRGKEAVVVGRSEIVGKPLSLLLLEQSATVTICHSGTSQAGKLEEHVAKADVLVAAIGKPNFIPGKWIKKGAIVIDVGINRVDGKIVGDVDFEGAKTKASYITPVPGGVGPVTVMILMQNALEAFKLQHTERVKVLK